MRTTLSLDDDVLLAVKGRVRRERRSVGAVLSELARQALTARQPGAARRGVPRLPAAAAARRAAVQRDDRSVAGGRAGVSRALLDINVLLALLDSDHVDHDRTRVWLDGEIATGWASCAITQNGFVRIVSRPRYPSPVAPAEAADVLGRACASPHHEF
jgi:hypothetical protein